MLRTVWLSFTARTYNIFAIEASDVIANTQVNHSDAFALTKYTPNEVSILKQALFLRILFFRSMTL